jgi:hypothetical protein
MEEDKLDKSTKRIYLFIALFIIALPFLSILATKLVPPSSVEIVSGAPSAGLALNLRETLVGKLKPNESILWVGRPEPGRETAVNWYVIPFAIVWTLFSFFILSSDLVSPKREADPARFFRWGFALLFVPAGIFISVLPFFTYGSAVETIYVITDAHVFRIIRDKPKVMTAFNWRAFGPIKVKPYSKERSDIMFARQYSDDKKPNIGFYGVEQADRITNILQKYLKARTKENLDPDENFHTRPVDMD